MGSGSGPVRTCIGCRERTTKDLLVRVVAVASGTTTAVVPDTTGTAQGRGAHLHPTTSCLQRATQRNAFGRALRVAGQFDLAPLSAYVQTCCTAPHPAVPRPEVEH